MKRAKLRPRERRFLRELEAASITGSNVELEGLANRLGVSASEAFEVADVLRDRGLVTAPALHVGDEWERTLVVLTDAGRKAIA